MRKISYAMAINEALAEELERDERVFLMGEDVGVMGGVFSVTRGLADKFGRDRVKDTPISEMAILGSAMGAALTGIPPRQGLKEYRKVISPECPAPLSLPFPHNELGRFQHPALKIRQQSQRYSRRHSLPVQLSLKLTQ